MPSQYGGYEDQAFIAELYDHIPGYAGRPDQGFYLDYARAAGGKTVELVCGTGRLLIPIAAAGSASPSCSGALIDRRCGTIRQR
jgi:hypothetical protein